MIQSVILYLKLGVDRKNRTVRNRFTRKRKLASGWVYYMYQVIQIVYSVLHS